MTNFQFSVKEQEILHELFSLQCDLTVDNHARTVQHSKGVKRRKISLSATTGDAVEMEILGQSDMSYKRRRRWYSTALYIFPNYDKCNSLRYFPQAMARHLNCADFDQLRALFAAHLAPQCDISFHCYPGKPTPNSFALLFGFMNEMHPDSVMCVHKTTIVGNEIRASLYIKFTNCRVIIDALQQSVTDPFGRSILSLCTCEEIAKRRAALGGLLTEADKLYEVVGSGQDCVVYVTAQMTLTLNPDTHKIAALTMDGALSSIEPLERNY